MNDIQPGGVFKLALGSWLLALKGGEDFMCNGPHVLGLKASIPSVQATFHQLNDIRHFDIFAVGSVHLKKPSGGPKGLIGPPCHGAPGPPEKAFYYGGNE